MSKGTVFYIGGFELPDKNAAALRVIANGKILRSLGYEVVFVGVDSSLRAGSDAQRALYSNFECWSVPYPKTSVEWVRYICGLQSVMGVLRKSRTDKMVAAICYNYPAVASLRIRQHCRKFGMKFIADATEWYDASGGQLVHRLIKFADTGLRMHLVNQLCDGVFTTSKYLTDFYSKRGKTTVELPTLFDATVFSAPPLRDPESPKKFIYVGSPFDVGRVNRDRTNLKERLDSCIELFYELYLKGKIFSFDVYGILEADYLKVFPEHVSVLKKMMGAVRFHGRRPNAEVLSFIAQSDFSIFFRDKTRVTLAGFPSKLAESITIGTPVISNTMMSLEPYSDAPGVMLFEKGGAVRGVESLIDLSSDGVDQLKRRAFESKTFSYEQYVYAVSDFIEKVRI
ncbi:hypothetical protein M2396_000012 [Pseudomonas sp. BIGb0278]|uniref:hypothetical protein n=1 Tax=Pseudomonas sp. BIGb0278 TaxID=2940607 RepID=UPI002169D9F8|nr:hypothetical protein [Pseudomonas sp. BIGb0278]MCS4281747.1 hypothetical protein [Pseudomonas sp. BIGb0278]